MEGHRAVVVGSSLRVSRLTVLLCFSKLGDDGNAEEFLSSQLNCERDRLFVPKFDVANSDTRLVEDIWM